jgi:hypothetical protein
MKQQYIIFGILILTLALFYVWKGMKKEVQLTPNKLREENNKLGKMEIKRTDLEQTNDIADIYYDLTQKYYPDYDDENFEKLDLVTQTFVLIVNADGQINNGGVVQFIDNSTGNLFHETIDAAKRIKNDSLVSILTKATTQYPNGQIPKNWEYRRNLWDELCEVHENDESWDNLWEELDRSYYNNSKTIYQSLIEYLKTNAKLID